MSQAKRGRMDDRMGEESSSEEEVTIIYDGIIFDALDLGFGCGHG